MAERDLLRSWVRKERAQRALGGDAACTCGERRAFALIRESNPTVCFRCDRVAHRRPPYEFNHIFGQNNSDATLPRPINDHRAVLSVAQYDWPRQVRENPEGSPVIAAAGMRLGARNEISYILEQDVSGQFLLDLDAFLSDRLGPRWWIGTPLEKYAPALERRAKGARRSSGRLKGLSGPP